ncbi:MAG TPA: hypothetical protein VF100_13500 [Thermoanaerobaculia bacterium]
MPRPTTHRSIPVLAALALALAAAVAAGAQEIRVGPPPPDGTRLLAVEVLVTDLATNRTVAYELGQHVPLSAGDRVRVDLVGSAHVDGAGRRVALPADFTAGGGGRRLGLAPTRQGGVVVHAEQAGGDDGDRQTAQIRFDLRGQYEPPRLASGFVTFEIAPPAAVAAPSERWQLSERLAHDLGHVLLVERPQVDEAWAVRIHDTGLTGARALGRQLAATALRDRRLEEMPPWEVTAHLYRHLLGRQGTADELWRRDPGFWESVELLDERGYATLVDTLLQSRELAERYQLARFEVLPRGERPIARPRP